MAGRAGVYDGADELQEVGSDRAGGIPRKDRARHKAVNCDRHDQS